MVQWLETIQGATLADLTYIPLAPAGLHLFFFFFFYPCGFIMHVILLHANFLALPKHGMSMPKLLLCTAWGRENFAVNDGPLCTLSCESDLIFFFFVGGGYKIFTASMSVPCDHTGCIKIHPRKWGAELGSPFKSTGPMQRAFNMHQSSIRIKIHLFNRGLVNY